MAILRATFSQAWQLNDRRSSKPLYVLSHAPLPLGPGAEPVEL
jgi:hypothetical protein